MKQISEKHVPLPQREDVKEEGDDGSDSGYQRKKSNTLLLFKGDNVVNALFARVGGNSGSESVKR